MGGWGLSISLDFVFDLVCLGDGSTISGWGTGSGEGERDVGGELEDGE